VFAFLHPRGRGPAGPRLEGQRIVLRPPRAKYWRAWAAVRRESRDFLAPWEPTWPADALTRGSFRRRVRSHAHEFRRGTGITFLILRRSDGAVLGGITVADIQRSVAQACSLGYWIGRDHARQGYMHEALGLVLRHVFVDQGLHRVNAACLPSNAASQGLLRKLGFRQEGYAREYLRIDGRWQDHLLFALLAGEWQRPAQTARAAE
jgi:ribosomal-protein-alanine N-acetyltransferase